MNYEIRNASSDAFPVVVSIPHSGVLLPQEVRSALLPGVLLPNTDWLLPELYAFLEASGVTMLVNRVSRYAADVNRDPNLRDGSVSYTRRPVYEYTTWNRTMYPRPLTEQEIAARIAACHTPYHTALRSLLEQKLRRFETVYLFDLHSFMGAYVGDTGADVVLGSAEGKACPDAHLRRVRESFERAGFSVSCNRPFGGGYITRHYGGGRIAALLVELRYTRYIAQRVFGEEEIPRSGVDPALFARAQACLGQVFAEVLASLRSE